MFYSAPALVAVVRTRVVTGLTGRFLQILAGVLAVPIPFAFAVGEGVSVWAGFAVASVSALVIGWLMSRAEVESPEADEAMYVTVLGWTLAVLFGAVPFLPELSLVNAVFEAASGFTTTGMSMVGNPGSLSQTLLFWRGFMQWVGGVGVLTFFVFVIKRSGGVTKRLYSAEANKTDAKSLHPSLKRSIGALVVAYIALSTLFATTYFGLGMEPLNAVIYSFSTISTGGFETSAAGMAGFSPEIQGVTVFFMLFSAANLILVYLILKLNPGPLAESDEFRLYIKIFLFVAAVISIDLASSTESVSRLALDSLFQASAFVSSTGFLTRPVSVLGAGTLSILLGVMFVGGCLGSTTGGIKVFRLKAMMKLARRKKREYSLPNTAVNKVRIDREILSDSSLDTITVLVFMWVALTGLGAVVTVYLEPLNFSEALSGTLSAAGTMGPVFFPEGHSVSAMSPITKLLWVGLMIAGRLEMLPLLAMFNSDLFRNN